MAHEQTENKEANNEDNDKKTDQAQSGPAWAKNLKKSSGTSFHYNSSDAQ